MSEWLKPEEYMTQVDNLALDEETNFNHVDCPAGDDTKRRLYVKHTEGGYVAYCHHCNKKGFAKSNIRTYEMRRTMSGSHGTTPTKHATLVRTFSNSFSAGTDINHMLLLNKASISTEVAEKYALRADHKTGRLILPIFSHAIQDNRFVKEYMYVQLRDTNPKHTTKYLNIDKRLKQDYKPVWEQCVKITDSTVVIVEDILSGIRIAECGYNVIALLGTTLNNKVLVDIINKYDKVIIWLDGDAAGQNATVKIHKSLNNYVDARTLYTTCDPKLYDDDRIRMEIGGVLHE